MKDINDNGSIKVETYGIANFLKELEPLLKSGYSLDFIENENYPQSFGAFYSATVVKSTASVDEVKEKKAGRPAKVS